VLLYLTFFSFIGLFVILITILKCDSDSIRKLCIEVSLYLLIASVIILLNFGIDFPDLSFIAKTNFSKLGRENMIFIIDGITILFIILTLFLIFLCFVFFYSKEKNIKFYCILLVALQLLILLMFCVLNIFFFYILFETVLIPMYLLIGIWGSREKKVRASYLFVFYTVLSSLLMLIGILYMQFLTGTFHLEQLLLTKFSFENQLLLWLTLFLSFSSKIPIFPFHIWLPEAHVEAPTVGSVLLAGILLKLGVYGFLRYSLTIFPQASIYFSPLVFVFSLLGIIYASITAIKQTDFKKIIAYSSVAHMNLVVLGIFSGNIIGVEGSIIQSISHGFIASALFFLIGMLYNRYHSRLIYYYSGIVQIMPLYCIFFLFFTMSNIALPGTSNFVGEFLLLNGFFFQSFYGCFLATLGVIFSAGYSLWLYNRVSFGNIKNIFILKYIDLFINEFFICFTLFIFSIFLGLYPISFFNMIHLSVVKMFATSLI